MTWVRLLVISCGAAVALGGCGDKTDPRISCDNFDLVDVTYTSTVQAILEDHCRACHSLDAANRYKAPKDVNFDDVFDAQEHSKRAAIRALSGTMPPPKSLATAGVAPLTAIQRCQMDAWHRAGSPQ
ncbi:MAG: hypothetical protein R3C68_12350 [Myxococcota bacterium]